MLLKFQLVSSVSHLSILVICMGLQPDYKRPFVSQYSESGWWWGCCAVVFSGDLLFAGIVMGGYLQQQTLTWNIVSTEEGRYKYMFSHLLLPTGCCMTVLNSCRQLLRLRHIIISDMTILHGYMGMKACSNSACWAGFHTSFLSGGRKCRCMQSVHAVILSTAAG